MSVKRRAEVPIEHLQEQVSLAQSEDSNNSILSEKRLDDQKQPDQGSQNSRSPPTMPQE